MIEWPGSVQLCFRSCKALAKLTHRPNVRRPRRGEENQGASGSPDSKSCPASKPSPEPRSSTVADYGARRSTHSAVKVRGRMILVSEIIPPDEPRDRTWLQHRTQIRYAPPMVADSADETLALLNGQSP